MIDTSITLVNAIFGATKMRAVLGVFEGADFEIKSAFLYQIWFFHNRHHVVKQNITGRSAH